MDGVETIKADLLDADATKQALQGVGDTTHVFYAALKGSQDLAQEEAVNGAMLRNLLDGLKAAGAKLERVVHYQGAKVYGVHLGHSLAPFYEDDARHLGPNFYYAQEDLLRERAAAGEFEWAILRSDVVVGDIVGNPMNIVMVMGVFAEPDPNARNDAFNLVGEPFRWERIWKKVAENFGMEVGSVQPFSLARQMPSQAGAWQRLAERHGLKQVDYARLVAWPFGDFIFNTEFDMISDMGKIRRAGFTEAVQTEATITAALDSLCAQGYLP